ncbi:MAG: Flp pilus assembly complex ATPase component TadA, partial [Nitrospirae bacterium]|nr:Flp pilus assembly complex ATPase component TadA [Nitrospirota bacterium]
MKKLGSVLLEERLVTQKQLDEALILQPVNKKKLGDILVEMGFLTDKQISEALAGQLGMPLVGCSGLKATNEVLAIIPRDMAEKKSVFPLHIDGKRLTLAMADPFDFQCIDDLSFSTGLIVVPCVAAKSDIQSAIEKHYGTVEHIYDLLQEIPTYENVEYVRAAPMEEEAGLTTESLEKLSLAPPIIKLVTMILVDAVKSRASDVHIEPRETHVQVRFRVDGDLRDVMKFPKNIHAPVVSRVKIISHLDITNRMLPQDGRSALRVAEKDIDLRISTMPSAYGETIVIRLLDHTTGLIPLARLGIPEDILREMVRAFSLPQGMVLVTGPTGSGKSTTLYAVLQQLRNERDNIISIEDPVEYKLPGITQIEVNEATGMKFPIALRSVFRQDPDIIMVGEVRDFETADIAIRAALTGHLVLSTVHTNDTVSTITRLLDIGLPPYLVNSAITGVLAQRLVKKICLDCREETTPQPGLLKAGFPPLRRTFRGKGCSLCNYTGYFGRI